MAQDKEQIEMESVSNEDTKMESVESIPKWLQKLQNESWQAEILISSGAFIGLISIINAFRDFGIVLFYSSNISIYILLFLFVTVVFCWDLLTIGFLVHLILRGYWIGLIGLNYIFPLGINKERMSFKGKFSTLIRNPSNTPLILMLDKICGGIFAFTFLSLFSLIGFLIFGGTVTFILISIRQIGSDPLFAGTGIFLTLVGVISLLDFLTFGWLKRIRWFSLIYYPIHYAISLITLSITNRRLYYTLISNIKSRYIFIFILSQILLIIIIFKVPDGSSGFAKTIFDVNSGIGETSNQFLTIENEVIRGNTLEISLMHPIRFEEPMFRTWQKNNKDTSNISNFSKISLKDQKVLIDSTYQVFIDGLRIRNIDWSMQQQRSADFLFSPMINRLRSKIDISSIQLGEHVLAIKINGIESGILFKLSDDQGLGYNAKINFYVEKDNWEKKID